MRSSREIAFRLRQELKNFYFFLKPPEANFDSQLSPRLALPDPQSVALALTGAAFAREIVSIAEQIRKHQFPIFGQIVDTGPEIRWRRDYASGLETGLDYFRRIPYLDASIAGDHKFIWELNRHQHLMVLAQAYLFTGDAANLEEISAQLESWFEQNPYHRGINWVSALEVAIRALSWLWVYHCIGAKVPDPFRTNWLRQLYRHGCHIENNLSYYFSPNTHLLGEALALHALGQFFSSTRWELLGAQVMNQQMDRQVRNDGTHCEQSTYYHLYALDMFLLHAILAKPDRAYMDKLERMAEYLHTIMGPSRTLPFLGDDDGGRLFHPYGPRDRFGRATLATASAIFEHPGWLDTPGDRHTQAVWWLDALDVPVSPRAAQRESRLFPDAGIAVMIFGQNQIIVDAGPFGPWNAGHSHSDALSIVVRSGDDEILIDPGTYTYVGDPVWRDWFRGTGAHNTIRIDGLDQAIPAGPFRWINRPGVKVLAWQTNVQKDVFEAECRFAGFTHRRHVEFQKPDLVIVVDDVEGPPGQHGIEQLWHLGSPEARVRLVVEEDAELIESWRSPVFGEKHPAPLVRLYRRCELPLRLETRIQIHPRTK